MDNKNYYIYKGQKFKKKTYYKTSLGDYVVNDQGNWEVVREGELVFNQYWGQIQFGELDAVEITEEEFNDALEKSKNGVEGYKWF